jgi:hypothetical protein
MKTAEIVHLTAGSYHTSTSAVRICGQAKPAKVAAVENAISQAAFILEHIDRRPPETQISCNSDLL